jgi:hypothetical protein
LVWADAGDVVASAPASSNPAASRPEYFLVM